MPSPIPPPYQSTTDDPSFNNSVSTTDLIPTDGDSTRTDATRDRDDQSLRSNVDDGEDSASEGSKRDFEFSEQTGVIHFKDDEGISFPMYRNLTKQEAEIRCEIIAIENEKTDIEFRIRRAWPVFSDLEQIKLESVMKRLKIKEEELYSMAAIICAEMHRREMRERRGI